MYGVSLTLLKYMHSCHILFHYPNKFHFALSFNRLLLILSKKIVSHLFYFLAYLLRSFLQNNEKEKSTKMKEVWQLSQKLEAIPQYDPLENGGKCHSYRIRGIFWNKSKEKLHTQQKDSTIWNDKWSVKLTDHNIDRIVKYNACQLNFTKIIHNGQYDVDSVKGYKLTPNQALKEF